VVVTQVFASNPSLMAVARVFEHYPYLNRQNLAVLSLGCGGKNYSIETSAFAPHSPLSVL
jgi:hypothetical protein